MGYRRIIRKELEQIYTDTPAELITILVPSYKEEPAVVQLTLMSGMLTEYPNCRPA